MFVPTTRGQSMKQSHKILAGIPTRMQPPYCIPAQLRQTGQPNMLQV